VKEHFTRFGFLSLMTIILLLEACGGRATSPLATPLGAPVTAPTPVPTPCSGGPQLALAFPSNGAIGVSDGLSSVLFITGPSVLTNPGSWGNMSLNGVTEGQVGPPPSPLPSPIPTLGPGQAYLSAAVTTPLAAKTMYLVNVSYTDVCGLPDNYSVGAFTSQ